MLPVFLWHGRVPPKSVSIRRRHVAGHLAALPKPRNCRLARNSFQLRCRLPVPDPGSGTPIPEPSGRCGSLLLFSVTGAETRVFPVHAAHTERSRAPQTPIFSSGFDRVGR
jgi:hypothetical protein